MSLSLDEEHRYMAVLIMGDHRRRDLNGWERRFLDSHITNYMEIGADVFLSVKTWGVLNRMARKVGLDE